MEDQIKVVEGIVFNLEEIQEVIRELGIELQVEIRVPDESPIIGRKDDGIIDGAYALIDDYHYIELNKDLTSSRKAAFVLAHELVHAKQHEREGAHDDLERFMKRREQDMKECGAYTQDLPNGDSVVVYNDSEMPWWEEEANEEGLSIIKNYEMLVVEKKGKSR